MGVVWGKGARRQPVPQNSKPNPPLSGRSHPKRTRPIKSLPPINKQTLKQARKRTYQLQFHLQPALPPRFPLLHQFRGVVPLALEGFVAPASPPPPGDEDGLLSLLLVGGWVDRKEGRRVRAMSFVVDT